MDGHSRCGDGGGMYCRRRYLALVLYAMLSELAGAGLGIDCFKCISLNGDNRACDDPFHNNYTLTTDTELVRMSHCGGFYYDDRYVRGCLQSCNDADACNGAEPAAAASRRTVVLLAAVLYFYRPSLRSY